MLVGTAITGRENRPAVTVGRTPSIPATVTTTWAAYSATKRGGEFFLEVLAAEAARRDPDAEVLSLHADWAIGNAEIFRETADLALRIRSDVAAALVASAGAPPGRAGSA